MNMKTVKVAAATNEQLNWLVAFCEGYKPQHCFGKVFVGGDYHEDSFEPSTNWAHTGPIIEREWDNLMRRFQMVLSPSHGDQWPDYMLNSQSPLVAFMRCYVASKLGDTVEVPEELN